MPSREWDNGAEVRHRARLLKATGKLARESNRARLELFDGLDKVGSIYSNYLEALEARESISPFAGGDDETRKSGGEK